MAKNILMDLAFENFHKCMGIPDWNESDEVILVSSANKEQNETQIPLIKADLMFLDSVVSTVSFCNGTTAESCLEEAYEVIKDRKGKMIDGVFVKEEDL